VSLTVDQFREYVTSSLGDEAIQRLLDAAYESIILTAGPYASDGTITEILMSRSGPLLMLSRPAESVSEVIEGSGSLATTLAADDYELSQSGNILRRLNDGTNPAWRWRYRTFVTYLPQSDLAIRDVAQLELVKLEIAFNPTLVTQTIGSWSETYQQGRSYPEQRADILASLNPQTVGIW
jgi:hypothetical protein